MRAESFSPERLFDARYYATGCGRPYQRDAEWLGFFDRIAEHIVNTIKPRTVLDAGCAMGFLVERLRARGVEAFGIDISPYAISQVHESVKPFCQVGSIAEPFGRRYDLIVCIEVLEHMPPAEASQALVNLCAHTDDVLFSSSPHDYREATHFCVYPPERWAYLFAAQGFFRDLCFDASFITEWAVRYRRGQSGDAICAYERQVNLLQQENRQLRAVLLEQRSSDEAAHQTALLAEENARLRKLVEGYEKGRFIRLMKWLKEHLR